MIRTSAAAGEGFTQRETAMKNRTVEFFPGDDKNEDVEGHVAPETPDADEDVEAHVQPPKDLDVERV
jgi:hypothetical protein